MILRMRRICYRVAFLFVFPLASIAFARPMGDVETLLQANQAYEQGDYKKAIEQYLQLLKQGHSSDAIHFNLGNAYFRLNQFGQAIFHFRKGLVLAPRDPDIKYNLAFAREKVVDQIEAIPSFWAGLFPDFFTEKEIYLLVLFFSCVTLTLGLLHLYMKKNGVKWARNISFAVFIFSLLFLLGQEITVKAFGVVVAPEISVYSGFERDSVVLFRIHEGVEFHLTGSEGETWRQIKLTDGKKGWVRTEGIIF